MSKKIKLAIIDDYFHGPRYNAEVFNLCGSDFPDSLSHGDKVYGTICKYLVSLEDIYFYLCGIFDGKGNSSFYIIQYLEQLLEQHELDMVVLCLSFHNIDYYKKLIEIAKCYNNMYIFIAESNIKSELPAYNCSNMIHVNGGIFEAPDRFTLYSETKSYVVCDTLPEIMNDFVFNEYFVFNGSSKGTAILSAISAGLLMNGVGANGLIAELLKKSMIIDDDFHYVIDATYYHKFEEHYRIVIEIINEIIDEKIGFGHIHQLLNYNLYKIFCSDDKYLAFILSVLKRYNILIIPCQIKPFDIWNINYLVEWITRY